jgi:hypothetical protein
MTADFDDQGLGSNGDTDGNRVTVDLEFDTLRDFREQMGPYLNYDGLFIKTEDPLPRGTAVHFRFVMPEGFVLAEGTGVVASTRKPETDPGLDPGMTLWFDRVEKQSKVILDELVDFHIATGGEAFDLGRAGSSQAGDIPTDALAGGSAMPLETSGSGSSEHETVPDPGSPARVDGQDDYLPDWLSEVADEHDFDLATDGGDRVEDGEGQLGGGEPLLISDPEIEISLSGGDPDDLPTPAFDTGRAAPEVTLPAKDDNVLPTDLRIVPLVVAAAVLITASLSVWWVMSRAPSSDGVSSGRPATQEPAETPAEDPGVVFIEDDDQGTSQVAPTADEPADIVGPSPEVPVTRPTATALTVAATPRPTPRRPDRAAVSATRIVDIAVRRVGDRTVVAVQGNGDFEESMVRVAPMKDPARIWMRIRGIETFYRPNEIAVESPEVLRVRVGHHPEETPPSIYVVLDLADSSAVLRDTSVRGDMIQVAVGLP